MSYLLPFQYQLSYPPPELWGVGKLHIPALRKRNTWFQDGLFCLNKKLHPFVLFHYLDFLSDNWGLTWHQPRKQLTPFLVAARQHQRTYWKCIFPARIQIFHHADRGGGYSYNVGGKSLPATSLCIGWMSIRPRRAVSQ